MYNMYFPRKKLIDYSSISFLLLLLTQLINIIKFENLKFVHYFT